MGDPLAVWPAYAQMKNFVEIFFIFFETPAKLRISQYFGLLESEVCEPLWRHIRAAEANLPFSWIGTIWFLNTASVLHIYAVYRQRISVVQQYVI